MRNLFFFLVISVFTFGCLPKDGTWSDVGESPYALTEADVPLSVCSTLTGEDHKMLNEAVDAWNDAVGCEIFLSPAQKTCGPEDVARGVAEVLVDYGEQRINPRNGARIDGEAWFSITTRTSYVKLNLLSTTTTTYLILMHELGHVLGLSHDRWKLSVMRPGGHAPQSRDGYMALDRGPPWPIVSHQDRALLKERFCR